MARMVEGKLLGRKFQLDAVTPTELFVPTEGKNSVLQTLTICNYTDSNAYYNVYHDANGTTYNLTTRIRSAVLVPAYSQETINGFFGIDDTDGRIAVEDINGGQLTFMGWGTEQNYNPQIIYKQLGQVRPSDTNPTIVFQPTTGKKVKITDMFICNLNAGEDRSFRVYFNDGGTLFNGFNAAFFVQTIRKGQNFQWSANVWMNDSAGAAGFRSSGANDLNCTMYGIEMAGE